MIWRNSCKKLQLILCCSVLILICSTWLFVYTRERSNVCCSESTLINLATQLRQIKQSLEQQVRYLKQNGEVIKKDHNTSHVLRDASDKLNHVHSIFSMATLNHHTPSITNHERLIGDIVNILKDIETCMNDVQQLDVHLMETMQQRYSQMVKERTVPWLGDTVLPNGQTWRMLHINKAIHFHMVFFNNYNAITLHRTLQMMTAAVAYSFIDRTIKCLFVLGTFGQSSMVDVHQIFDIIKRVRFCKTIIWRLDLEEKQNDSFQEWWKIMTVVFEDSQGTHGFFKGHKGDVLFITENIVFSEDILEVASFASHVKNTLNNIWQLALVGEHGWNMVNCHPDTLMVQRTSQFLGHLYGFNMTIWRRIEVLKPFFYNQDDTWSKVLGKIISDTSTTFLVVIPTLARMSVTSSHSKYPWSLATRTIDTDLMTLNVGIRDVYGFLCEPDLLIPYNGIQRTMCPCSSTVWSEKRAKNMLCSTQPYHVQDTCFSGKFIEINYNKNV